MKVNYKRVKEDKEDNLKQWAEALEKNFYKSLDHRSFHFKFHEKKQ